MRLLNILCIAVSVSYCGSPDSKSSTKIINGINVSAGDPVENSTVMIHAHGQQSCSATIIGSRHVLTAAHCLDYPATTVGFGINGRRDQVRVIDKRVHPGYQSIGERHDIAVLLLEKGKLPANARPVKISATRVNAIVTIAGYGRLKTADYNSGGLLRKANTTIAAQIAQDFQFSADGNGSCYGDSGGSAYSTSGGGLQLVGVISRGGGPNCDSGDSIITGANFYLTWINQAFDSMGAPLNSQPSGNTADSTTPPACTPHQKQVVEAAKRAGESRSDLHPSFHKCWDSLFGSNG